MNLTFQESAIKELQLLAAADRHSVLIEGNVGCGKSMLAKEYGKMLDIMDFASISPTVQDIRSTLDASYDLTSPVLFCIENLDTGVPAASYTLLKFLEEPTSNVYIVVTCRNRYKVPDTIISRSTCVTVSTPIDRDVIDYAQLIDTVKYNRLSQQLAWKGVKTLNDVEYVYKLTSDQLAYYQTLIPLLQFKDTTSNIVWQLGHYEDNTETNIQFVFNFIIGASDSIRVRHYAIQAVDDLVRSRIAAHAVLAKFVLECKYGE